MNTLLTKLVTLVTKAGHTPVGKAVEHAVVAGAAVGISLVVKDASTGSLSLDAVTAALVATGSATLAGLRAVLKAQSSEVLGLVSAVAASADVPAPVETPAPAETPAPVAPTDGPVDPQAAPAA